MDDVVCYSRKTTSYDLLSRCIIVLVFVLFHDMYNGEGVVQKMCGLLINVKQFKWGERMIIIILLLEVLLF